MSPPTPAARRDRTLWAPRAVLVGLLVLALGLRLAFFTGFIGSDDSVYLEAAADLAYRGHWAGQDLASSRIGFVGATAAAIKLLGPNEFAAVSVSLLSSLLGLVLVYALGRRYWDERTALIGVLLLVFYPLDIVYATMLLPEPLLGTVMAAALLAYEISRQGAPSRGVVASLSTGVLFGLAWLVKEPGVLLLGALGLTWIPALFTHRRLERNWLLIGGGFLAVLSFEALVRELTTGTILGRFQVSERAVAWGLATLPIERESAHWYLYLRSMFFSIYEVGLLFFLLAASLIWAWIRRFRLPPALLVWLVVVLGYLTFGSVSFVTYLPLPKQPRYLEAITAPAILISAGVLAQLMATARPVGRRLAWAFVGLYALCGVGGALLSSSLERWQFEPVRVASTVLAEGRLVPLFASPRVANGLTELSGVATVVQQSRTQSCGQNGPFFLLVWAAPPGTRSGALTAPSSDCRDWRLWREVSLSPPRFVGRMLAFLGRALDEAPVPRTLAAKVHGTIVKNASTRVVRVFVPAAAGTP